MAKKHETRTALFTNTSVLLSALLVAASLIVLPGRIGMKPAAYQAPTVPGESYQICNNGQSQELTSPWTYDALASGSQSYTVSEYKTLLDQGAALPPLPDYIANEPSSTVAAVIYAPDTGGISLQGYQVSGTPVLNFFEGGSYGAIDLPSVSGDLFFGGSAPGYPEPEFDDQRGAGGISDSTSHYGFSGGHDTGSGSSGSSTLTVSGGGEQQNDWLTFADGTNYHIMSASGKTLTVSPALSAAESNTAFWYNDNNSGNGGLDQIAEVSADAARGSTQMSIGGWTGSRITQPVVAGEHIVIGDATYANDYLVDSVTGSQSGGYTLTLDAPLPAGIKAGMPIWYSDVAGGVSVEYLNIANDVHSTDGTITTGSYWTIEHNDIHDGYAGGANYQTTSATGIAVAAADHATIEYNCFQRMGEYALNGGGAGTAFDYNQVDETPYQPDLSGNGQSGCGKWWASFNNDIKYNAFTNERYSVCVWFDNGNTGMLVQGNYFYDIYGRSIQNETGYNSKYIDNLFEDDYSGIYQNDSGGWNIPNSRFNNQILMQNNYFYNVREGINIWGASQRSCLNSGESISNGESSPYCSGGFPQITGAQQYYSHNFDSVTGGLTTVTQNETCSSASPCSTLTLANAPAVDDWIGFEGAAPNTCTSAPCGSYTNDPVATTTSDTTDVSTFTSGQPGTMHVPSTTGFPSSGQLQVGTDAGSLYGSTGAVLSYTGITGTTFTGVVLVAGSGALTNGGTVIAVQPHHVTTVNCPGGNCSKNAVVSVSPAITSDLTAGTTVYATGTCPYYDTAAATASSPTTPDGTPYIDGCMWENRNIMVSGNTFYINPSQFSATPLPEGAGGNWSCTTGPSGDCGQNAMGYQFPGGNASPYNNVSFSNALMSNTALPAPFDNLNASGSPLATGSNGDVATNSESPYNNSWTGNTYLGNWRFQAYTQAATCPLTWTGTSLAWGGSGTNACDSLSVPQWQSYWHQDSSSAYNPTVVSLSSPTAGQQIHGPAQTITADEDSGNGSITSTFQLNGVTLSTQISAPYSYSLNTLPYSDGSYTLNVAGTDSGSSTDTDSATVYIANGDFNGDRRVSISDLAIMAAHWDQTDADYADGNITGQSTINISDLTILAGNYGRSW